MNVIKCSPVNNGNYIAGIVNQIDVNHSSNWEIHHCIRYSEAGKIILIKAIDKDTSKALIGSLITEFLVEKRNVCGIIVEGGIRDIAEIRRKEYPVWYATISPRGYPNQIRETHNQPITEELKDGGLAVCDDDGASIIPIENLTESTFDALVQVRIKELMWQYCLRELNWDTKSIVCEKDFDEIKSSAYQKSINPEWIDKISTLKGS